MSDWKHKHDFEIEKMKQGFEVINRRWAAQIAEFNAILDEVRDLQAQNNRILDRLEGREGEQNS